MSEESVKVAEQRRQSFGSEGFASRLSFSHGEIGDVADSVKDHQQKVEKGEEVGDSVAPFDVVVASEIIEHVDDIEGFFYGCTRCVKGNGGVLVVTTLNRTPESYLLAIVGAEYVTGIVPKGTHDWSKFVTPKHLDNLAKLSGMRKIEIQGVSYIPVVRQFVQEPFARVNYMAAYEKP